MSISIGPNVAHEGHSVTEMDYSRLFVRDESINYITHQYDVRKAVSRFGRRTTSQTFHWTSS